MGILHSHPAPKDEATVAAAVPRRRRIDQTYHVHVIRRRAGDTKDKKLVSTKMPTPWEQLLLFMSKTIATWSCPEWWSELETENERLLVLCMLNGVCYEYGRAMVRGRKIKTDWDWIEAQEVDLWNIDGHHIRQQVARYYRTCQVYPCIRGTNMLLHDDIDACFPKVTYLPWDAYQSRAAWRKHLEFLQSASAENSLAILRKAELKDAQPVWDELATLDRLPMYQLRQVCVCTAFRRIIVLQQIANAVKLDPTLCKVWTKVRASKYRTVILFFLQRSRRLGLAPSAQSPSTPIPMARDWSVSAAAQTVDKTRQYRAHFIAVASVSKSTGPCIKACVGVPWMMSIDFPQKSKSSTCPHGASSR